MRNSITFVTLMLFLCLIHDVEMQMLDGFNIYGIENIRLRREAANGGGRKKQCANSSEFRCKSGQCINEEQECDGIVDCEDGSDESNACHRIKCPPYLFRCKYGACINADKECDGKPDCRDKSDENSPKCQNITTAEQCGKNEFRCSSGQCINDDLKCDGKADCRDESDEISAICKDIQCPRYLYRCKYGACVDGNAECDGKVDCYDGSDEVCKTESKSCVLPDHPVFGKWTVLNSGNFSPNMTVAEATILQISCQKGYTLQGPNQIQCKNGTWFPNINIVCLRDASSTSTTPPTNIGSCTLPKHPDNGAWSVYKATTTYSPGMTVRDGDILNVQCNKGYALDGISPLSCINGKWSFAMGKCLKTCPPRKSSSVLTVTCYYNNVEMPDCTNPVDGTLAKFKCATFYEDPSLVRHPVHVCRDGTWNYQSPQCVPECGVKTVNAQTLIINGTNVKKGDYPWQAALYTDADKKFICGGSLISQRIILSAAHCVTDVNGKLLSKEDYVVGVGKYYRKYDDNRDKNDAQFSKLQELFIPKQYKGPTQNYLGDIAILVTIKTFTLSLKVQPVCIDWGSNFNKIADYGYVTGWGYTSENENPSDELKELKVPIVSEAQCTENLPEDYNIYLTYDKLCAGYLERGKSVCKGDSGSGLVVKHSNGRYFITGVVSLAPQSPTGGCDKQQYGLYTVVSHYINFITEKDSLFHVS